MKMKNKTRKAYAYGSTIRKPMMYGGTANQMSAQPLSSQQQNMTRKQREDMGMAAATNRPMMMAMGGKNKEFAALAPPRDKITYADKIAGATKTKRNG
jgi:hypothetical protein